MSVWWHFCISSVLATFIKDIDVYSLQSVQFFHQRLGYISALPHMMLRLAWLLGHFQTPLIR